MLPKRITDNPDIARMALTAKGVEVADKLPEVIDCGFGLSPEELAVLDQDFANETECVMCGKEGAATRSDGKAYCGHCWMVWNS